MTINESPSMATANSGYTSKGYASGGNRYWVGVMEWTRASAIVANAKNTTSVPISLVMAVLPE